MVLCFVLFLVLFVFQFDYFVVVFIDLFRFFAVLVFVAEEAIEGRFADVDDGREWFGFVSGGEVADAFRGLERGNAGSEIGGETEAVEEQAGATRVHIGRIESAEDLGERDLDAPGVLNSEHGQFLGSAAGGIGKALKVVVVVAMVFVAQRGGVALLPAGHNMPAFGVHGRFSGGVYPILCWQSLAPK